MTTKVKEPSKALKKIFANLDLSKTEEQDDGTVKVWGYASADTEDSDGETITADAMKAALPDYLKWGAVREMHQAKAAGTAIEAEVQDDGKTWFGAHIVDSEAVKKVKANVYKGFSIGGKVTERDELNKSVIKGLKLIEVSLVDRPANPDAVFTMYKAETLEEEQPAEEISAVDALAELLNKGEISAEKLLELAKGANKADDEEHDIQPEKKPEETVEKGMWSLQDFASVLSTLGWICQDAQYEADYEGDNSPIPAQLRAWFATGAQIFKDMAAEETAELLAQLKAQAGEVDVIEMAAKGIDIAKAGKRFSKATKETLGAIHKAAQDACDHLGKLGYDNDDDEEDKIEDADKTGDLAKVSAAHDDLLKAIGTAGCPEGAIAADFVKAMATERDELQKRVNELEAKPAPGKALLKAISKGSDVVSGDGDDVNKVAPVTDHKGETNEVATLIKSIHAGKL
jgi:phage head maturation protease